MPHFNLGIQVFVDPLGDDAVGGLPPRATVTFLVTAPDASSAVQQLGAALQRMLAAPAPCGGDSERVMALLARFHPHADDRLRWLTTPHAELDGITPLLLIIQGKERVVRDMLEAAYQGLPT